MKSAVCVIVKDELQYLLEWIAYQYLVGFDRVIVYNNNSTDGSAELLKKLSDAGKIDCHFWETPSFGSPQLTAYKDCLSRYKDEHEYIAFFDADEFLVTKNLNLQEYFKNIPENVSAIAVNQLVFGSSGRSENSQEPVVERFTKCCSSDFEGRFWFKSIIRVDRVVDFKSPHLANIKDGVYVSPNLSELEVDEKHAGRSLSINDEEMHLNHYIIKSREEFFDKKMKRGGAAALNEEYRMKRYNEEFFDFRDKVANKNDFYFEKSFLDELNNEIDTLKNICGI